MKSCPHPSQLLTKLRATGFRTTRRLGQHFLFDPEILERIADAAGADRRTLAVEIGPGACTLTALLAQRAGGVLAVERDERLRPFHAQHFGDAERLRFAYADALQIDLREAAANHAEAWRLDRKVLVGNIPFQITSPLLFKQTGADVPWERMTLTIQKEVADRITAGPHTRDYGILTVKLAYWWRVVERFDVPASRFRPPPQVDASVLTFAPVAAHEQLPNDTWTGLSKFIDAAFNQRRKKLYNSPAAARIEGGKMRLHEAMVETGINPEARAENLSPEDFLRLFRAAEQRAAS